MIVSAFEKIDRKEFVRASDEKEAYEDYPLSIGQGQTISQPWTVAFMLELLQPQPSEKIMDIGSGSGWATSLLAYCASQKENYKLQMSNNKQSSNFQIQNGKVIALEVISELCEFGKQNCEKYWFVSKGIAEFVCRDGNLGYEEQAPYDKILASAALNKKEIPEAWQKQLRVGGRIVCPVMASVWVFDKINNREFQ